MPLWIDPETGHPTASATENVGLEALRLEIANLVDDSKENDPLSLPDNWHRRQ
jgi:hypothetical protein